MLRKVSVILAALLVTACYQQVPIVIPPGSMHTHSYHESGYEAIDDVLYKVLVCSCGDRILEKVDNGVVAHPDNAQEKLDALQSNQILYFTAGSYDELSIRNAKGNSECYYGGVQVPETELTVGKAYTYKRTLENVMLAASSDAVFKGLRLSSGHIYGSQASPQWDAVREIAVVDNGNTAYYAEFHIDGLTISGFCFDASQIYFGVSQEYTTICNLKVVDSSFSNINEDTPALRFGTDLEGIYRDFIFENLRIGNVFQGIYVQNPDGMTVKNCIISNTRHNAVAFQSSESTAKGTLVLEGCTITETGDRAVRFGSCSDSEIRITGNVFVNATDTDNELLKGSFTGSSIEFRNNKYNGRLMDDIDETIDDGEYIITV